MLSSTLLYGLQSDNRDILAVVVSASTTKNGRQYVPMDMHRCSWFVVLSMPLSMSQGQSSEQLLSMSGEGPSVQASQCASHVATTVERSAVLSWPRARHEMGRSDVLL